MRRATISTAKRAHISSNFYPRSPCGERLSHGAHIVVDEDFYPRSPCGERHLPSRPIDRKLYFYPRSPCGERRQQRRVGCHANCISIHALLAESDTMFPCFIIIYIKFLSTLSLRRATRCSSVSPNRSGFLSTLSLRRATRAERYANSQQEFLSTLSLRRATDTSKDTIKTVTNFYPRSPCGERQAANGLADAPPKISIHALLAESDSRSAAGPAGSRHFYPRSPCGERLAGAISQLQRRTDFYPRSPCGERRLRLAMIPFFLYFYPRSPCGERLGLDGRFKL